MASLMEFTMEREPILVEREKTHGAFAENARIFNDITRVLPDTLKGRQRAAMVMICMKIARIYSNPNNVDSWLDLAGYAKLGEEACDVAEE